MAGGDVAWFGPYRDLQTGEIAWFINFIALCLLSLGAVGVLALAVLMGDETALGLVPQHWLIHAENASIITHAVDVLDQGFASVAKLVFRGGLAICLVIVVLHFAERIFRKKRRVPRAEGTAQ